MTDEGNPEHKGPNLLATGIRALGVPSLFRKAVLDPQAGRGFIDRMQHRHRPVLTPRP